MKKEDRAFLLTGVIMMASELLKQLTLILEYGSYQWWYFPWQLCSVPMYACVLVYITGRIYKKTGSAGFKGMREALITFMADFSLMSGIAAFFDTSGMHYTVAWLTIHSYLWHFAIIALGIFSGTRKRDVTFKAFIPAAFIYLAAAAAAEVFNICFNPFGEINMFYISPYYNMGQVGFRELTLFLPNAAVIAIYVAASLAGGLLFHALWKWLHML